MLEACLGAYSVSIPEEKAEENTPCMDVIKVAEVPERKAEIRATIKQESIKEYKVYAKKKKVAKKRRERARRAKEKRINKNKEYLLAKLIYCEVGAVDNTEVLYLCGSVVLNRIKDKRYPDTMEGVIYQSGQWEVTWNGAFSYKVPDKRCRKVAHDLMLNGPINSEVNAMSERVWGRFYKRFGNVVFSIC